MQCRWAHGVHKTVADVHGDIVRCPLRQGASHGNDPYEDGTRWLLHCSASVPPLLNMRRLNSLLWAAALGLTMTSVGAQTSAASAPAAKPARIVDIDDADPLMKQAFIRARASLNGFLKTAESGNPAITNAALRVVIREGDVQEYLWILPFKRTGNNFSGTVNAVPRFLKKVTVAQTVTFTRADIADWMYVDTSKKVMYGNFTTCAMALKESPGDIPELKKRFGLDCRR